MEIKKEKQKARIDNWAVGTTNVVDEGMRYMHPELRSAIYGTFLVGKSKGHPRLPDGLDIKTSRLVGFNIKKRIAETVNTIYTLGNPDPGFVEWLKSKEMTIDDLDGEMNDDRADGR